MTTPSDMEASTRSVLDQAIRQAGAESEPCVERHVTYGRPAQVLSEMARAATLLVVGSRGRGGFPGLRTTQLNARFTSGSRSATTAGTR